MGVGGNRHTGIAFLGALIVLCPNTRSILGSKGAHTRSQTLIQSPAPRMLVLDALSPTHPDHCVTQLKLICSSQLLQALVTFPPCPSFQELRAGCNRCLPHTPPAFSHTTTLWSGLRNTDRPPKRGLLRLAQGNFSAASCVPAGQQSTPAAGPQLQQGSPPNRLLCSAPALTEEASRLASSPSSHKHVPKERTENWPAAASVQGDRVGGGGAVSVQALGRFALSLPGGTAEVSTLQIQPGDTWLQTSKVCLSPLPLGWGLAWPGRPAGEGSATPKPELSTSQPDSWVLSLCCRRPGAGVGMGWAPGQASFHLPVQCQGETRGSWGAGGSSGERPLEALGLLSCLPQPSFLLFCGACPGLGQPPTHPAA